MATRVLQFVTGEVNVVFSPQVEIHRRRRAEKQLETATGKSVDQLRRELEMVPRARRANLLKRLAGVLG